MGLSSAVFSGLSSAHVRKNVGLGRTCGGGARVSRAASASVGGWGVCVWKTQMKLGSLRVADSAEVVSGFAELGRSSHHRGFRGQLQPRLIQEDSIKHGAVTKCWG